MTFVINIEQLAKDAADQQKLAKEKIYSLNDVRMLAERQRILELELEILEGKTEAKKAELKRVAEEELPDMLNAVGLPSITLADGSIIAISDNTSASITDDNRSAAHKWMREKGFGDLIKNVVSVTFGKGEDHFAVELVQTINKLADNGELKFGTLDQKEAVHPSTLKAFVRERLKNGDELPAQTFKLFIGEVCRIKKPKVKV